MLVSVMAHELLVKNFLYIKLSLMIIQESSHGLSHSVPFESVHDEHKPLLHVNSSEPSLSSNDVIASGSGKKARRQKHVHFSGTESEERAVRPPSSRSDERPTNNYEVVQ